MKTGFRITALLLLMAVWIPTAAAGTEEDPEVTSLCGTPGLVPTHDSLDICSAWFSGMWQPDPSSDPDREDWVFTGLRSTLRVERLLDDRPVYARYAVGWSVGDCDMVWYLHRPADAADWQVTFSHCLQDGTYAFHVVPDDQVSITGDTLVVELLVATDLATVAPLFSSGAELEGLYAKTLVGVETAAHPFEATYSIDYADGSRGFVIGQDRPTGSGN